MRDEQLSIICELRQLEHWNCDFGNFRRCWRATANR